MHATVNTPVSVKQISLTRRIFSSCVALILLGAYLVWQSFFPRLTVNVGELSIPLPFPDLNPGAKTSFTFDGIEIAFFSKTLLSDYKVDLIAARRQEQIDRVERFFQSYGSQLAGYGHIFVDQSEACDGNYRVLVGIAGSESGLGRIMYKKYNPFGYLDGVQYNSLEEALTVLSCKISVQHISKCDEDLYCLARRYAGPADDVEHFVSKVRWFMNQV